MDININGINRTNMILVAVYITYSILLWFPIPRVLPVPLAGNFIGITKHGCFLMRGLWSSFCKFHSSRTSYHSNMEWTPYQRKISHLSNGIIPIVNQSRSQQSAWPSNRPRVQRSHPVWKIMTLICCFVFLCCKKLKHENQIISNKKKSVIRIQPY